MSDHDTRDAITAALTRTPHTAHSIALTTGKPIRTVTRCLWQLHADAQAKLTISDDRKPIALWSLP